MTKNLWLVVGLCFLFVGCAGVSQGGDYWGKYSYTYHDMLKNPGEKSKAAHEATLRDIIEKSAEKEIRVPPGIHAELAHLLSKKGEDSDALAQFEEELKHYPESKIFLERLISK